MDAKPAIQIDRLTVRFGSDVVLRDFSLQVEFGERVDLTGRSGSGKSTVLRSMLGFVIPCSGMVCIDGTVLTSVSVWDIRQKVAYVPQEPELGTGSVADILARPFEYRANVHLRRNLERIGTFFERFRLSSSLLNKDIGSVSAGEKQRIALIGALLLERDILLLDEPASALDADSARAVASYLNEQRELTLLCASHGIGRLPLDGRSVAMPDENPKAEDRL